MALCIFFNLEMKHLRKIDNLLKLNNKTNLLQLNFVIAPI